MHNLAYELQKAAHTAAGPIKPGMSIKAQINQCCDNLGYPRGHWRVRAAWYGEAHNWQGEAIFDFLDRYHRYLRKASTGSRPAPADDPLSNLIAMGS